MARSIIIRGTLTVAVAIGTMAAGTRAVPPAAAGRSADTVRFSEDVFPIIKDHCLPCHAEDNYNPSELSLDTYERLMEGGRHGKAVIPGNSEESSLIRKLLPDPPFGDQMPITKRKRRGEKPEVTPLDEETIRLIATWIDQGARDN